MGKIKTFPELIDHIGWDFWRVTDTWKRRFTSGMLSRGYGWYAEARGSLIRYIGHDGIGQRELARRAAMSKQAIQQHLDDLVSDGIVERISDPSDARKNLIRFTEEGFEALEAANEIKVEIEEEYRRLIGNKAMEELKNSIDKILQADASIRKTDDRK